MKSQRSMVFFLFVIVCMATAVCVYAQRGERQRMNYSERIAQIMKDAGCPLTETQLKAVGKVQPGTEARKKLDKILNEQQRNVLDKNENDRRITMIIRSLENTDNAITPEQQKKLKAVKPGSKARIEINDILTDAQKEELKKVETRRSSQGPVMRMAQVLQEAGKPLTEEQMKKLQAIQPGPDSRDSFRGILTPEQQKIIDESFRNRQPRQ